MLLHALYERLCTAPLNRLPCYGALEVIVTLLLLLLLVYLFSMSINRHLAGDADGKEVWTERRLAAALASLCTLA